MGTNTVLIIAVVALVMIVCAITIAIVYYKTKVNTPA